MGKAKNLTLYKGDSLSKLVNLVQEERRPVAEKLAVEIAFMSRTLEALRSAVDEMGPLDNPALKTYNTTIQRYGAIVKQFTDLLPKAEKENAGGALYNFIRQGCGVVDGTFKDDTFLPVIYELDSREEWTDPAMWEKANPGIGVIKKVSDLADKVERAKNSPKDLAGILCKDFNIRGTVTSAWLSFDAINNEKAFDIARFRGCWAIGGADRRHRKPVRRLCRPV